MNRKQLLYFLLLICPFFIQAQSIQKSFSWNGLQEIFLGEKLKSTVLSFDGSLYHYKYGMLPVSIDKISLSSGTDRLMLKLSNLQIEEVPVDIIEKLDDIHSIPERFSLFSENAIYNGKARADIVLVPLRYNPEKQVFEKILSCTINYEIVEMQSVDNRGVSNDFSLNSVLSTGKWYRIATTQNGIHKISYTELKDMGMDIDNIDPRNIRIFGNGNGMVPESNAEERPDDLNENAIEIVGEDDGSFDPSDYILFYAQGPVKWTYNFFKGFFEHENNYYTDEVNYFITADLGAGKRVIKHAVIPEEPTHSINTFSDYQAHEIDEINVLKSGKFWFGEEYKTQLTFDYLFNFDNINTNEDVKLRTNVVARSTETSSFSFKYNGQVFLNVPINKVSLNSTIYAWALTPEIAEFQPLSDDVMVSVTYNPTSNIAVGWMNFIEVNASRNLVMSGSQLAFRDTKNIADSVILEYHISNTNANLRIWDVSDIFNVHEKSGTFTGSDFVFKSVNDDLYEYIAFDETSFHSVSFIEEVDNQNLHAHNSVDFVIITHPDFYNQAVRIGDIHQQHDGFSYSVVTLQQVYNEFSSGVQDISALRDYCRMIYHRGDSTNRLKYVLLFGDGSYDPKCRHIDNCSFVPTFQSKESLKHGYSLVNDDFFGLYDPDEGNNAYGKTVDAGVGRFPVSNLEQATQVVDKIEYYLSNDKKVFGNWRNTVCFIADDEDNNIHFKQAERLVNLVDTTYENFLIDKIYLDAYVQIQTVDGYRYPDVTKAIDNAMDQGALIINYTGHGGETGLAFEKVLLIPDINAWRNKDNMPLLITATCEFSRFDDPGFTSAGEYAILNPDGGSISIFTTTRLAWSDPNFKLNRIIYENCFERVNGEYPRLGDLVRIAKTEMYSSQNIKNFVLLGDPALQLAYPEHLVKTNSVNVRNIQGNTDTIQALSELTISGHIEDIHGTIQTNFNGILIPTVYDKKSNYRTLANDAGSQVADFTLCDKVLYEGKVSVTDGMFTFTFKMPREMNYNYGDGRISYFAYDTVSFEDAHGREDIVIGGINSNVPLDQNGPDIKIFLNDITFKSGEYVNPDPILMVKLYDEQGIDHYNTTVGHEITGILDDKHREPMQLNNFYEADLDSYTSGWVYYPMDSISDGLHTLKIKAWDLHNNSSENQISFYVNKEGDLAVNEVQNIPNPFSGQTTFVFNHNKPGAAFDIEIIIYDVTGQEVARLQQSVQGNVNGLDPIRWDGTGSGGGRLSRGIYPYTIRITDDNGYYKEYSQKLIIGR